MSDSGRQASERTILKPAVATLLFPFRAVLWAAHQVCKQGRWKKALVGGSVLFNVLFIALVTIGMVVVKTDERRIMRRVRQGSERGPSLGSILGLVPYNFPPLSFLRRTPIIGFGETSCDSPYVASNSTGKVLGNFVVDDDQGDRIIIIDIYDQYERCWVSADLRRGSMTIMQYADDSFESFAPVWLLDRDGDGVPDMMFNQDTGTKYERANELVWRQVDEE